MLFAKRGEVMSCHEKNIAIRISVVTIAVNLLLTVFKLVSGIIADSYAMISDAVHSASDVFSTLIVIIGIRIAAKSSDDKHQFGHDRFECVAAILLAFVLGLVGGGIGVAGVKSLADKSYAVESKPLTTLALVAAIVSIVTKEAMYWYTRHGAKRTGSGALMADAWHHRSDALSSIGSLIAIIGVKVGVPVLDPIASVIICLFVLRAAIMIFVDAVRKMTDEALDDGSIKKIVEVVLSQSGVIGIDSLKTRKFGDKSYVELEIEVDCALTLLDAHEIAERVHDAIEQSLERVKHCVVHVNPGLGCKNGQESQEAPETGE